MDFHQASYQRHIHTTHDSILSKTWKNEKTIDHWRHLRMYQQLDSLLTSYPRSSWLTIGDGRYGTDAHYLLQFGVDVMASDINGASLQEAKQDGFITHFAVENAERLSFPDRQFDFVLCKESFHHFPRPALALYEMLRVARIGIVLIEPNDQSLVEPYRYGIRSATFWWLFAMKQWLKGVIGKAKSKFPNRYEVIGNYVYTISKRELEKAALGMNLDVIAFKGLNDHYIEGVEHEEVKNESTLFQKVKKEIQIQDKRSARRPETYGLLVAVIFKSQPKAECLDLLRKNQFEISVLEKNPYIKDS